MGTFTADASKWVQKSKARMLAVRNHAAQSIAEGLTKPVGEGGNMRVKTGFLRASLMASTSQMPTINPEGVPIDGQTYSGDSSAISLVIAGASPTDTIYMGFTAAYARPREYEDGFIRLEAQRWQQIVDESAAIIKGRVQSR